MNPNLPWHRSGHVLMDARDQAIGAIDDVEIADMILLAVNHHGDLRGALNYITQRAAGCVPADYERLTPIIVNCAILALKRLNTQRPILTDNIQMDSNVLDDLVSATEALIRAAKRQRPAGDEIERTEMALSRVK